jgi:hypothetical protein
MRQPRFPAARLPGLELQFETDPASADGFS